MLLCASNPCIKEMVNQLFQPRKFFFSIVYMLIVNCRLPMKYVHVVTETNMQAAMFREYGKSYLAYGWLQKPLKLLEMSCGLSVSSPADYMFCGNLCAILCSLTTTVSQCLLLQGSPLVYSVPQSNPYQTCQWHSELGSSVAYQNHCFNLVIQISNQDKNPLFEIANLKYSAKLALHCTSSRG